VSNRVFFYPDFRAYVLFAPNALEHMYAHIQWRWWQKEAGGEIYTVNPGSHGLLITTATGPSSADRRSRHFFNPDIQAATRERERQFYKNRHAVGLWHTHPEPRPSPSGRDHQTTQRYLEAFRGDRETYLMVIVGNSGDQPNMAVWSAGKNPQTQWIELVEA
jgi:integrative and conjugative element protein (TIGR02256 family)